MIFYRWFGGDMSRQTEWQETHEKSNALLGDFPSKYYCKSEATRWVTRVNYPHGISLKALVSLVLWAVRNPEIRDGFI